ncbi:MAG: mechanosensitive ion channel family protein [Vampirovibrionales bacterium]
MGLESLELITHYPWLGYRVLGNNILAWLIAGAFALAAWGVFNLLQHLAVRRLKAVQGNFVGQYTDFLATLLAKVNPLIEILIALMMGLYFVQLPNGFGVVLRHVLVLSVLIQLAFWAKPVVSFGMDLYINGQATDEEKKVAETLRGVVTITALTLIFSVLVMLGLDHFGVNITALVTGLGIGGVAMALAVQNTLKDLLAALAIVTDQPFTVGDFIIVGTEMGTVKHIGLKTTRLQSLSGEELVFSNDDLLSSRVRNFLKMHERRVVFGLGVTYDTPVDKLATIPDTVRGIIEAQAFTRADRAHFAKFGASSLDFEFVYYVEGNDYSRYMDVQQAINLAIMRHFADHGIEFAFPTQTLYHQPGNKDLPIRLAGKVETAPVS